MPPRTTAGSPRRRAALLVACLVAAIAALATPSAAQSRPVNVEISVDPREPQPGDDVTTQAFIIGCPPQDFPVEAYLVSSDGATRSAALMAQARSRTTLLWGSRAQLELPSALEGWYGVRVQCGLFRPARLPLPNTTFAVGSNVTKESTAEPREVPLGGTFNYVGRGCPGPIIDYEVTQTERRQTPFEADGSFAVEADGAWGGQVTLPDKLSPGSADVRARCSIVNQYGDTVNIYYELTGGITILES